MTSPVSLSGILATATAAADFNVGKMPYGTRSFPGNVRNLRIWVGEARSAAQIASDYSSTPLAGSGSDDSDFSWPLNETAVGAVTNGKGGVGLTMTNVSETDFVACCTNNRASGHAMTYRPTRIDLGSADSESVILVQAKDYSGTALRLRVLPPLDTNGNVLAGSALQAWNHVSKAWIGSGTINSGVPIDNTLGNPATGTYFWIPIRRNTSSVGTGRYVDDDSETVYDGTDTDAGTRTYYNSIMPLPGITAMTNPWTISGNLIGTATYPTTRKYVILGYDQTTAGTLIAACSTPVTASKDGKGTVTFNLNTDLTLKRIEVRTQDDVLVTQYLKPEGWSTTATLEPQTLPIVLSGFLVTAQGDQARIQWNTASETNMQGFRIYRHNLEDLSSASIISPLIEASNTTLTQSYVFLDVEVPCAGLWYYWLEALEMDGNSQFYGPVVVLLEEPDNPAPPSLIIPGINSIYPNPFGSSTQIRYGLIDPGDTELRIFNLRGQVIKTWSYPNQARGTYNVYWDNLGTDLPNGVYILQFLSGKRSETRRITLLK
ncbi:MAG: T9SS type A sorting domain-containing protein [Candidatus Cloacimonadota bacterium]